MPDIRKLGETSNTLRFLIPSTGLAYNTSGLIISTIADNEASSTAYTEASSNIENITTSLGTFETPTASKCRFKEVDSTNHPYLYELHIANARFSVSSAKRLIITVSGGGLSDPVHYEIEFTPPVNVLQLGDDEIALEALTAFCAAQHYDTAQAGDTNTITLAASESSVTDYWAKSAIQILSGTGAGQVNRATAYDGSTKVLTVVDNWKTQPDNTSVYMLIGRIE